MAGRRKKVAEKDYDALIKTSEEKIKKLTEDIKTERIHLKMLKKDKARYDEQMAEEAEIKKKAEIVQMIANSGKSMDEIKAFLEGKSLKK